MLVSSEFDKFLEKTILSLRGYLDHLVCIGGCANALYRHHPKASRSDIKPIVTLDIDLASEPSLPIKERPIAEIMIDSGMKEELSGNGPQPVSRYLLENSSFKGEIEFLCPSRRINRGRGYHSSGGAVSIQEKLTAQPLDYLEILLYRPWNLDLGIIPEYRHLNGITVRVPNPVSYVIQKVLIRNKRRDRESLEKDSFYIFEISTLFRDHYDTLAAEYAMISGKYPARWLKRFHRIMTMMFSDEHSPGTTEACAVYHDFHNTSATELIDGIRVTRSVNNMLRYFK